MRRGRARTLTRADWIELLFLGLVGTFLYQLCFVAGVRRTSVGNGSLIVGMSPIVIALMSAMAGHERISLLRWAGVFMALVGLYFVVGKGVDFSAQTLRGDLLMLGGVFCWATYSVASQSILKRHSPLIVIGLTFSIGAALYVLMMVPTLIGCELARGLRIQLVPDGGVGAPRAERVVLDLVYGPEETRRLAHVGVQLPDADRGDDRRGDLDRRADFRQPDCRRGGDFRRAPDHAVYPTYPGFSLSLRSSQASIPRQARIRPTELSRYD